MEITDLDKIAAGTVSGYKNAIVSQVNDHVVRMSVMTEDFFWHYHPNSDETFIVLEGILLIDLETEILELAKGQMATIPKNVAHRTRPKGERSVNLTVELAEMETIRILER